MKTLIMYAIFDNRAQRYDTPFFAFNDIMAERRFLMTVREKTSIFSHFTKDFDLVKLSSFDIETGKISISESQVTILYGSQIQKEGE